MKVTVPILAASLFLSVLPGAPAAEAPPYPYAPPPLPSWKVALRKKLEDTKCTFTFQKESLRAALEKVAAAAGVSIEVGEEAGEAAEKTIDLSCKQMGAIDLLNQLAMETRLAYKLTERGVLFTERPTEADPSAEQNRIGDWIEHIDVLRLTKAKVGSFVPIGNSKAVKERKEAFEKKKEALRSTKVTKDFTDAKVEAMLGELGQMAGVRIVMINKAREKLGPETKITVKGGSRPVEKVLEEVLKPRGLRWEQDFWQSHPELILIVLESDPPRTWSFMFLTIKDREPAERKVLNTKLKVDLKGSRVCDLVDALGKDLGMNVYTDRAAWPAEVKLPPKTAGMTVRKLVEALRVKGIELTVSWGPACDRLQDYDKPPEWGGKPVGPPLGDFDWSVYLLKPKM